MPRSLFSLAFPNVTREHAQWIDRARTDNVRNVEPHFTLAFGVSEVSDSDYCNHVQAIASANIGFDFRCRHVTVGTDHRDQSGYTFLVPDKGNGAIYDLHRQLYSGILSGYRKLEIPFVPHMTLGRFPDLETTSDTCDAINADGVDISGSISEIAVVAAENGNVTTIAKFPLRSAK